MDEYKIPSDFKHWKTGGYANIYKFHDEIIKELPLLSENEDYLLYSSFIEIIITKTLPKYSHFVDCHAVYITNNHVYIHQEYLGKTLYNWMVSTPLEERILSIPNIIYQMLTICIFLQSHGIQYTDLKPTNFIWNNNKLYLIDYNCISIMCSHNGQLLFSRAIGTWNYAAPEVILYSNIDTTSVIWSIGMILCEMFGDYPISAKYYPYKLNEKREYWINMYKIIYDTEFSDLAFINSYSAIPEPWNGWIKKMLMWNPKNRIHLIQLRSLILNHYTNIPSISIKKDNIEIIPYHYKNKRSKILDTLYDYAVNINEEYKLCLAIYIWDMFSSNMNHKNCKLYLCAAWALSNFMYNNYSDTNDLRKKLKVKCSDIQPYIIEMGDKTDWHLYAKTVDIYLHIKYNKVPWAEFIPFYSKYTNNYIPASLATDFFKHYPSI